MGKAHDNFPSLTLCRRIPAGMLTDTQFVWVKTTGGAVFVMERADAGDSEVEVLAPAPTETECHMEAEELGLCPVVPDRAARALMDVLKPDQPEPRKTVTEAHAPCKNGRKFTLPAARHPAVPKELAERFSEIRHTVRDRFSAGDVISAEALVKWAGKHWISAAQLCLAAGCDRNALSRVTPFVIDKFRVYYGINLEA